MRDRYLFISDTHLWPWNWYPILKTILDQKPKGVFLTGDIAEGPLLTASLEFLGKRIGRPLYFTLGNHCYWFSSFKERNEEVKHLCGKYNKLNWLTNSPVISLNEEVAVIGTEGWYDARVGNSEYIKYTLDHRLIKEFSILTNLKSKIELCRHLADESARFITSQLEAALENHKKIILLTHMPPWQEANRCSGFISEAFWTPYNTNYALGVALENVMEKHKKRSLIVLAGHNHKKTTIEVSRNIQCRVHSGSYINLTDDEVIFI